MSDVLSSSIRFVQAEINKVDHVNNKVETSSGSFDYDWLISSLGCHIEVDEVEGLSEALGDNAFTFYTLPEALKMQKALEEFKEGHFVVDIAEVPIKCPVAPIEAVFLADYYFHTKGVRDNIQITLVTPYAGAFTKPNANAVLSELAENRNINVIPNFELEKVDAKTKTMTAYSGQSLQYDFLCIVPPTRGPQVMKEASLSNDTNYGMTDHRTLKSKIADNIYFIGDNADLPTSKAGSVSHFEAETVVENLLLEIEGKPPKQSFDGHANCFIESGYHKALIIDFNYDIEPLGGKFPVPYVGPFSLLEETYINHLGKMAFKWLYWNLIVSGRMPDMPFVPSHMSLAGKNLAQSAEAKKAHALHIKDIMTSDVHVVTEGTPLHDAANLMDKQQVSGLPVVASTGKLVGILTRADMINALDIEHQSKINTLIAAAIRKGRTKKLGSIVDDLMSTKLVTTSPEASASDAVALMARHKINRIIVVNENQQVVGIVSRADLLRIYEK